MRNVSFNDVLAVTLIAFGLAGAFVSMYWKESVGATLCSILIGYGLGIYGGRAKP